MKIMAVIPARYQASRLPGKLMKMLGDKTVIRHTYENTRATLLFDEVMVVTDSELIFNEIVQCGGYAVMSKREHQSGSDRIAEAIENIDVDVVINVQGDEPFVEKEILQKLISVFKHTGDKDVPVASLMYSMQNEEDITNPNHVKVVVDNNNFALYFSRGVIPYHRDTERPVVYYKHIGIYGFQKQALMKFTAWPASMLESLEKLEQLRYLENGVGIKMVIIKECPIAIDTAEDLEKARIYLENKTTKL